MLVSQNCHILQPRHFPALNYKIYFAVHLLVVQKSSDYFQYARASTVSDGPSKQALSRKIQTLPTLYHNFMVRSYRPFCFVHCLLVNNDE